MAAVSVRFDPSPSRNRLLAVLSRADFALLQAHLQPVAMNLKKDLERPNRRIETVYFMETGIASVVAIQPDETQVEVGLIGCEGLSGSAIVLGGDQSPHSTYIQIAGWAQRIPGDKLRKVMRGSETFAACCSNSCTSSRCRPRTPPSPTRVPISTNVWRVGF